MSRRHGRRTQGRARARRPAHRRARLGLGLHAVHPARRHRVDQPQLRRRRRRRHLSLDLRRLLLLHAFSRHRLRLRPRARADGRHRGHPSGRRRRRAHRVHGLRRHGAEVRPRAEGPAEQEAGRDPRAQPADRGRRVRGGARSEASRCRFRRSKPFRRRSTSRRSTTPSAALTESARRYDKALVSARAEGRANESDALVALNAKLRQAEIQLIDNDGLFRRPWYRHLVYAPGFYTGYGVKTIPGVREGIEDGRYSDAELEVTRVARALDASDDARRLCVCGSRAARALINRVESARFERRDLRVALASACGFPRRRRGSLLAARSASLHPPRARLGEDRTVTTTVHRRSPQSTLYAKIRAPVRRTHEEADSHNRPVCRRCVRSASAAAAPPAVPARVPTITPVTDAMLQNPDPNDWLMWRRTLNGWGFSPLDQINEDNVEASAHGLGARPRTAGIQEGTPLVHNGVMFIPNPGDDIMAVDARTGDLIWEYKRKLPEGVARQDEPRDRDVGHDAHQLEQRQLHLRARHGDRQAGRGKRRCSIRRCARRPAAARSSPTAR